MRKYQLGEIQDVEVNLDDFFPTGFTIELSSGKYFTGWKNRSIHYGSLARAKYFPSIKAAEDYINHSLCFVGLDPYICKVGWILTDIENNVSCEKEEYTKNSWETKWFWSYVEALRFQEQHSLRDTSMIEYQSYRIKIVVIAAA